ncbi:MAG: succinate dehydrogenase, cytochrome b556 subunit [Rhodocyclaceae bacterium]|nr:succinate dehydrogenase, cytochrome b556 subunit [Rhodocyclaceae bacterium]
MAEMTIKKRPKHLDLTKIDLPLPGKVSILHRISGVGLFLCLPVILWLFSASLTSPETYASFKAVFSNWFVKFILAGLIWSYIHHFCAGIRFLLLDMHIGIEKAAARKSAGVVLAVSIPLTLIVWGILL